MSGNGREWLSQQKQYLQLENWLDNNLDEVAKLKKETSPLTIAMVQSFVEFNKLDDSCIEKLLDFFQLGIEAGFYHSKCGFTP